MAVVLLECRKDERQADIPCKEASSSILEMMANFTDSTISMEI